MIQDQNTDDSSKIYPETGEEETQLSRASFLTQLGRAAAAFAFGAPPICMALTTRIEHKINDDPEIPLKVLRRANLP